MAVVSIGKFKNYEDPLIDSFIASSLASLKTDLRNKKVLVKPNMLMARNTDAAVTTHPRIIESAVRELKAKGAEVWVGDTSGIPLPPAVIAGRLGVMDIVKRHGAHFADLTRDTIRVTRKENRLVKTFTLSRLVGEMDLIVNLPKLKTHVQAVYTGAVKNLFGIVPGVLKPQFHMKFPDIRHFAHMIVDLGQIIRPGLSIMDAITAMDGQGPSSGRPKYVGLLLSSADMVALDSVACHIIGQDPCRVPILEEAYADGLGELELNKIRLEGETDLEKLKVRDFILVESREGMHFSWSRKLQPLFKKFFTARPVILKKKCRRCHICVTVCPVKALSGNKGEVPVFDYKKCIRCYCCHEMCPHRSIEKKDNWVLRILLGRP